MAPTLLPSATDVETARLDALPRMSYGARTRTIPETQPEPGRYLVVEDAVSRRHAIIVNDDDAVRILDDRSANGTRVNGEPVPAADLRDGDVIVVGRVALTYREFA
jgi:pSer/pThr/pTyr-binding forkhead associated (FHA) protein